MNTNTDKKINTESNQKLTINEFKALLESSEWKREPSIELAGSDPRSEFVTGIDGKIKEIDIPVTCGSAEVVSALGSIVITSLEGFSHDTFDPSTLERSTDGLDSPIIVTGVTVLDEDGDEIDEGHLIDLVNEAELGRGGFVSSYGDYLPYLEEARKIASVDFDLDEASTSSNSFTLEPINGPAINFSGEEIGSATNKSFDNDVKWQSAYLFKTINDRYVALIEDVSIFGNESSTSEVKTCETIEEVKAFFGDCDLSREVMTKAGINQGKLKSRRSANDNSDQT